MKKVDAINAECQQGMIDTELAFISAAKQAAASNNSHHDSATSTLDINTAMSATNGFFAGNQHNASKLHLAAQR